MTGSSNSEESSNHRLSSNFFLFIDKVVDSVNYIAIAVFLAMFTIVNVIVFTRYFLNFVPIWRTALCRLLLVWFAVLGSSILAWRGGHIRVTNILKRFISEKGARILRFIQIVLYITLFIAFAYYGFSYALGAKGITHANLNIGYHIIYIVLPIGGVLLAFSYIAVLIKLISGREEPLAKEGGEGD